MENILRNVLILCFIDIISGIISDKTNWFYFSGASILIGCFEGILIGILYTTKKEQL